VMPHQNTRKVGRRHRHNVLIDLKTSKFNIKDIIMQGNTSMLVLHIVCGVTLVCIGWQSNQHSDGKSSSSLLYGISFYASLDIILSWLLLGN